MMELSLTNIDQVCLINKSDYDKISHFNWFLNDGGYVAKNHYIGNGEWDYLKIHRLIMVAEEGDIIDHKNGDKLDNTRGNLRLATRSQNRANAKLNKNNKTGFRGVLYRRGKYTASIRKNGKLMTLGTFEEKEDAARMYNLWAVDLFGDFCRLNDTCGEKTELVYFG